jgi:hypothetical protein
VRTPDVVYAAADGLQVTLEPHAWAHIQQRHPEVTLDYIAQALIRPVRICDHKTEPGQQVYEGAPGATPWLAVFPVVIVERRGAATGMVVTARLSRRPYPGAQRWP